MSGVRLHTHIEYITGNDALIERLTRLKLIVTVPHRQGYLVARWGILKRTLKKASRQLEGLE